MPAALSSWWLFCELWGELLYDFMLGLGEPDYLTFNRAFDVEIDRLS